MSIRDRVRLREEKLLSDDHYVLKKVTFDFRRSSGEWQTQTRETYDRGNAVTLLLYHPAQRTVILTRQFRYPAFVNGLDDLLIETPAGLLEGAAPEERVRAEAEEEVGYRVHEVHKVFEAYSSPGSVTELVHFFIATYDRDAKQHEGGGLHAEGEDIEVLEVDIDDALAMIDRGEIKDAKTIMLLQYAALKLFRN
ncbi:NUDIX domain-containing protein [Caldimonas brevitalea]|uniref:GDP-mannose pyrophosphatase n=1 Tax=Caldimonas brevitalea TaxID=413882 RepID=A0A0G3BH64_9BURK|nr:NUDIX domain-containing protein [Caldimonas brevitalea]AKJ26726.1 GDP-mannose pyrophosphatase [Caldimonas brevitalea]